MFVPYDSLQDTDVLVKVSTDEVIIVPEPHILDKNKENRFDYVEEIRGYMNTILDKIMTMNKPLVIFVGDIFDRGFSSDANLDEFCYWQDYFMLLNRYSSGVYSVIGNHETSFPKKNPFWRFVRTISSKIQQKFPKRSLSALGLLELIRVVDRIEVGNTIYTLAHHGYYPLPVEGYTNVMVSHNSVLSNEIRNTMKGKYNLDLLEKYIKYDRIGDFNVFRDYDYVFNGHMHSVFALFTMKVGTKTTRIRYLGSIGRTKEDEVLDKTLVRVLPIFKYSKDIEEPLFSEWELKLKSRSETIDEVSLQKSRVKTIAKQNYIDFVSNMPEDYDPVEGVYNSYTNPLIISIFDSSMLGVVPEIIQDCLNIAERKLDLS